MNGIRFNRKHCLPRKLLHTLLDLLCPIDTSKLLAMNVEVMQSIYQMHQIREKLPHLLWPTNLCTWSRGSEIIPSTQVQCGGLTDYMCSWRKLQVKQSYEPRCVLLPLKQRMEWKKLGSLARFSFLVFGNLLSPCLHRALRSRKSASSSLAHPSVTSAAPSGPHTQWCTACTPGWMVLLEKQLHSLGLSAGETCCLEQLAHLPYFSLLWRQDTQKSCFRHPRAHWICFLPPAQCNQYQQSVMHLPVLAEVQATGNCILVVNAIIIWAPCLAVTGFTLPICRLLVLYHLQPAFSLVLVFSQDDMLIWFE